MSENITVKVITESVAEEIEILHDKKNTLLQTFQNNRIINVISAALCGGNGGCGRCRVRFRKNAPLPTQTDRSFLSPDMLRQGYRLACKARPMQDCVIEMAFIQPKETKNIEIVTANHIATSNIREEKADEKSGESYPAVAAVDIGTTTIAMQLVKATSGRILDTYTCLNPQRSFGDNVIARIQAGSHGKGQILQQLVQEAVCRGIKRFEKYAAGDELCKFERIIISGNTTMIHLFMGYPVESLGRSPFEPVNIHGITMEWDGYKTFIVPGVSAFVGGDVLSGLLACDLYENKGKWLFLDLGTNAEMVMGNGKRIVCTAAAAGPAFEGKGENTALGSKRIHAIASLLKQGVIDETGRMEKMSKTRDLIKESDISGDSEISICQKDVRDIQMAKAAIRTGIDFLMNYLGVENYEQIERIYIAGGFGFYLDSEDAVRIGLLPNVLQDRIVAVGNTSLAGAVMLGQYISGDIGDVLTKLEQYVKGMDSYNLAESESFDKIYINYINFPGLW